jgi:hypothetical protein
MTDPIKRRAFLKQSLAATAALPAVHWLGSTAAAGTEPDAERLTTYQVGPHVWVRWANRLLTSYRAHPSQKYPYMYPLAGPASGLSLTAETSLPYPHHRSLLFACDYVNGGNYWQGDFQRGQILSDGPRLGECTPRSAEILDTCRWIRPGQPEAMTDRRKITVTVVNPRLRFVDVRIEWTASADVTIRKTNHSLFAIRAATDITPLGGGTLINSEGRTGEEATFGKPAAWCGYFGKRQPPAGPSDSDSASNTVVEGIAILDHPGNPWASCPWFTRDYGFISPTPFQFIKEPWQLPAGKSVTLRYRVVLFVGDPKEAELDAIHKRWIAG